jgi:hypothetical protein
MKARLGVNHFSEDGAGALISCSFSSSMERCFDYEDEDEDEDEDDGGSPFTERQALDP